MLPPSRPPRLTARSTDRPRCGTQAPRTSFARSVYAGEDTSPRDGAGARPDCQKAVAPPRISTLAGRRNLDSTRHPPKPSLTGSPGRTRPIAERLPDLAQVKCMRPFGFGARQLSSSARRQRPGVQQPASRESIERAACRSLRECDARITAARARAHECGKRASLLSPRGFTGSARWRCSRDRDSVRHAGSGLTAGGMAVTASTAKKCAWRP